MKNTSLVNLFGGNRSPYFFNDYFNDFLPSTPHEYFKETENAYLAAVDMPGIKAEDIKIDIDENMIKIEAHRVDHYSENEETKRDYNFQFSLPTNVDSENINAHYENGVLEFALKKKHVKKELKKINVSTGKRPEIFNDSTPKLKQ